MMASALPLVHYRVLHLRWPQLETPGLPTHQAPQHLVVAVRAHHLAVRLVRIVEAYDLDQEAEARASVWNFL